MYKKNVQPPTPNINNSKKVSKYGQKNLPSIADRKNQTNTQFKNKEDHLLQMIKQYLHSNGYLRSYQILKNQKPNIRTRVQINNTQNRQETQKNLIIQAFDKGNRQQFFKMASKYFNVYQEQTKKLQFQIHIYFLIYNIHPSIKKQQILDKYHQQAFKKYLQTKGQQLSSVPQFINYFALGYTPKPQQNSLLAHLFTKQWLTKIKNKFMDFFTAVTKPSNSLSISNMKTSCELQQLYYSYLNTSRQQSKQNCNHNIEIETIKAENTQLRSIIQNYQKRFNQFAQSAKQNLFQSNQKWFLFSRQIFNIARKYMKEDKLKMIEKYQSFFIGNIEDMIESNQISIFDKNSYFCDENNDISKQKIQARRPEEQLQNNNYQIDLNKIKGLFLQSNIKDKQIQICSVLKALKDRFSRKANSVQRKEIIIQYSRSDICGVQQQNYIIQKKLFFDGSERIKVFYIKLMQVLTLDVFGIQYLTKSKKLIQNLVGIFNMQTEESRSRKPVLSILQRLSFSKQPRMLMINLGIIPMIFKTFKNQGAELSQFTIQFLIAMMMNLSLKKQSKPDFQKHKTQIVQIAIEQMANQNDQIRNYTNGTLYLLLKSQSIKEQAIKQKLDIIVKNLLQTNQDDVCYQQYGYILKRLNGEQEEDADRDSDSQEEQEGQMQDYQDQFDGQFSQSDSDDYIQGEIELVAGEEYLIKNYALLGPQALRQQILTRSVLDQTSKRLNNMTTSINRSRRLDNIFSQKANMSVIDQQFDILKKKK